MRTKNILKTDPCSSPFSWPGWHSSKTLLWQLERLHKGTCLVNNSSSQGSRPRTKAAIFLLFSGRWSAGWSLQHPRYTSTRALVASSSLHLSATDEGADCVFWGTSRARRKVNFLRETAPVSSVANSTKSDFLGGTWYRNSLLPLCSFGIENCQNSLCSILCLGSK